MTVWKDFRPSYISEAVLAHDIYAFHSKIGFFLLNPVFLLIVFYKYIELTTFFIASFGFCTRAKPDGVFC
jgi:hypothetical protein